MTTQSETRFTRYTFVITVVVVGALAVGGLIVGTAIWPKASAAPASSGIEITALMSNVDVAKLPATEITERF